MRLRVGEARVVFGVTGVTGKRIVHFVEHGGHDDRRRCGRLKKRYVDVYDIDGRYERVDASVETYSPAIITDLSLSSRAMFAELDLIDDIPE